MALRNLGAIDNIASRCANCNGCNRARVDLVSGAARCHDAIELGPGKANAVRARNRADLCRGAAGIDAINAQPRSRNNVAAQ